MRIEKFNDFNKERKSLYRFNEEIKWKNKIATAAVIGSLACSGLTSCEKEDFNDINIEQTQTQDNLMIGNWLSEYKRSIIYGGSSDIHECSFKLTILENGKYIISNIHFGSNIFGNNIEGEYWIEYNITDLNGKDLEKVIFFENSNGIIIPFELKSGHIGSENYYPISNYQYSIPGSPDIILKKAILSNTGQASDLLENDDYGPSGDLIGLKKDY